MSKKSKKAVSQPGHPTLKALPKLRGGYYRRVKDIPRALDEIEFDKLPPVIQFLILFFGCEKLALGIIGVDAKFASDDAYGKGKFVELDKVKASVARLKMSITDGELETIFGASDTSARELRHKIVHDLGPSNVKKVRARCAGVMPVMQKFLGCIGEFHQHQKRTFG